jgi:hypothetical protein
MIRTLFNTGWSSLTGFSHPAHRYARLGRFLLSLTSIVLIALPFTQHLWTWDRFLHGGQDFETSVLLIVTSLCLVLVMVRGCKQWLTLLLTFLARLVVSLRHLAIAPPDQLFISLNDPRPGAPVALYNPPLLI